MRNDRLNAGHHYKLTNDDSLKHSEIIVTNNDLKANMNCSKETTTTGNSADRMMMEEEAGGGMTIAVSDESVDSDLTIDIGTNATDIYKGEAMDMDVEQEEDSGTASSVTKDEKTNDAEDFMMEVEEPNGIVDATEEHHAAEEETDDVLDLEKLYELLEQSKKAGDLIAGKNVMLLIGGTGAGKTTTTLYLAGVKFEEVEVKGLDHYEPLNLPPDLVHFAVSGGATSVTKTIHATTVELPNGGGSITICDTPGFGDTKGTEMEISNGLGVIHALKRAATVKPVVVLNHKEMDGSRYAPLRKTLGTIIEMMGHCKDFSPFEYIFTRCEGKSINRVHRQLAGFQDTLRENAKDILGDNVEIKDVLDALLTEMVKKTKPQALSIDPTESKDAPTVLEALWCNNKACIDRPGESFFDFIPKEASDKLDRQVNRMAARIEKALKAQRFAHASSTLQQLIRLADVLPLPQMENAVRKGKHTAHEFVKHLESEASQLVDRIVEQADLGKAKDLLSALCEKLLLLSDTRAICDICQAPDDEHYEAFLTSSVIRLFAEVESSVQAIGPDQVVESQSLLQSFLLRAVCFSNALDGLGCNELTQACLTVKSMVFTKTQSVLSAILDIEDDAEDISSVVLGEWRTGIIFLVDMYALFETHGITISSVDIGRKALSSILNRVVETNDKYLARLDEMTRNTSKFDESVENASSALQTLCSSESQECRQYILCLLSSTPLVPAVYPNGTQSEQSLALVIENFDLGVSSIIKKTADAVQKSAEATIERKKIQSIKESIKAAQDLEGIVTATSNVCGDLKKWSGFDWQFDDVDKALYATRKNLESFIGKQKKLNSGPEELLYGPGVLGKQFHDMLFELRAYKYAKGHCNVHQKDPLNKKLGRWVDKQRQENKKLKAGRKSTLTNARLQALDHLEFEWSPNDTVWNCHFNEVCAFKEKHGNILVPVKGTLYSWINLQRYYRKAQKDGKRPRGVDGLTRERIAKLESIGILLE